MAQSVKGGTSQKCLGMTALQGCCKDTIKIIYVKCFADIESVLQIRILLSIKSCEFKIEKSNRLRERERDLI